LSQRKGHGDGLASSTAKGVSHISTAQLQVTRGAATGKVLGQRVPFPGLSVTLAECQGSLQGLAVYSRLKNRLKGLFRHPLEFFSTLFLGTSSGCLGTSRNFGSASGTRSKVTQEAALLKHSL